MLHYVLLDACTALVAHINEDIPNSAHLITKEKGFTDNFLQENLKNQYTVARQELSKPNSLVFNEQLAKLRKEHPDLKGIYVSNSKAYEIAFYLEKHRLTNIKLIGYDLLPKNIQYLEDGV